MNTANLQIEGMLMALSATMRVLREKGLLSREEIDEALRSAESSALADRRRPEEVSASNVEAVLFPIRFLAVANRRLDGGAPSAFSDIATEVGQTKNDVPRS